MAQIGAEVGSGEAVEVGAMVEVGTGVGAMVGAAVAGKGSQVLVVQLHVVADEHVKVPLQQHCCVVVL